ncbi:MAG: hypothetical protein ACI843_001861 [Psychrobacter glaciei]|jgi:hypothetical protein
MSNICNAYMSGVGSVELGLSAENEKTTMGMIGDYALTSIGSNLSSNINSEFKLGADLGVDSNNKSTTESNYPYDKSLIGISGEFDYQFDHRSVRWHNNFETEIVFREENDQVTLDIDHEKSWSVTTGPSLMIGKRSNLQLEAEILTSYQSALGTKTSENISNLTMLKSLSPRTLVEVNGKNVCIRNLENESPEPENCRKEYNVMWQKISQHSELSLLRGISNIDTRDIQLYSISFRYDMNSYLNLSLRNSRSIDTIAEQENIILETITAVSLRVINTRSINFSLDLGRSKVDLGYIDQAIDDELSLTKSSITSARIAYPIEFKLCSLCNLNAAYEHSNFNQVKIQKLTTLSVIKYNTRQLSTAIKVSQSIVENEFEVWSLNLSISYNGLLEKVGSRQ